MREFTMNDVVKILVDNEYEFVGWKGSHAKFRRGAKIVMISRHCLQKHWVLKVLRKAGIDKGVLNDR